MAELRETVKRVELSWEHGFMEQEEYLAKRHELQREIEAHRPVDYAVLTEAADPLRNFRRYWDACADMDKPAEARRELVGRIVQSVYVYDHTLVGVVFHRDFAVILGENETAHAQIARAAYDHVAAAGLIAQSGYSQSGDDGLQPVAGHLLLFRLGKVRRSLARRVMAVTGQVALHQADRLALKRNSA